MSTSLGDSRPVTRTYGDGSVDCPYCANPILFPGKDCRNPACDTNCGKETLRARRAKQAERIAALEAIKRQAAAIREGDEQRELAHENWREAQINEALERGACLRCLFQPGYKRVRFVRHRGDCPST